MTFNDLVMFTAFPKVMLANAVRQTACTNMALHALTWNCMYATKFPWFKALPMHKLNHFTKSHFEKRVISH